jgi:drug/metabolite transporter (DMT)-like permease
MFDIKKDQFTPILFVLMFFWALLIPLSKMFLGDVSPALLSLLRNGLGAFSLLLLLLLKGKDLSIKLEDVVPISLLGIAGTALASILIFTGIELSSATSASILINTNPIFIALLAPFLISESLGKKQQIGIFLAFIGMVMVIVNGDDIQGMLQSQFLLGNLASIAAALLIGLFTIYGKRYVRRYGGVIATFYAVLAGFLFMFAYTGFTEGFGGIFELNLIQLGVIAYIGVVVTGFIYAIWYKSMKFIGASKAGSFKFLIPVFAAITSVIFLGEGPTIFTIIGGVLVLAGLLLSQGHKEDIKKVLNNPI